MSIHLESFARALGVFMSVFFTTRWASKSAPAYDTVLVLFAGLVAVLLAR